eukprot:2587246-Amphidinium_carterae.1
MIYKHLSVFSRRNQHFYHLGAPGAVASSESTPRKRPIFGDSPDRRRDILLSGSLESNRLNNANYERHVWKLPGSANSKYIPCNSGQCQSEALLFDVVSNSCFPQVERHCSYAGWLP